MATVLALVTDAFGGRGGIAQYNRDFLSALAEVGHSIIAVPRHAPDAADPPSGILQCRSRPGRIAYSLYALVETLRLRPDMIFCGHIYMAPLAWVAAKLSRARLVVQMHGIEAWPRPSALVRRACESATLVLNVSRYTRARVLDWAAIVPERAVVLPNTVAECFTPGDGLALRCDWGLESKTVLLTVGRTAASERYKGHDGVFSALLALVAAGHDAVYVIVGDGDDRPRLESLAVKMGLSERVRFVGVLPRERLIEAYRMADLFVMPSTGEGFGIAFLEALACGTPALGLAAAGSPDALADGALGFMTTEDDLVSAVTGVLDGQRPDPAILSSQARNRFGHEPFRARVAAALSELSEAA